MVKKPDRYYLQTPGDSKLGYFGKVIVKGELPGSHYITAHSSHSDGGMTVMGPIHGPITTGGATFSYLRGFWAIRFNDANQIVWQRFFQTQPTGPFFNGVIFADGSILVTIEQSDYLSIIKLDPEGYSAYWRHYSSILAVQSLSGIKDASVIIAASDKLVKLDPKGEVIWSKELVDAGDHTRIQYAFESENGDLVLFLRSGSSGVIAARLNLEQPFDGCPQIKFENFNLSEHSPLLPYNISSSVRVTPFPYDLVDWATSLTLNETAVEVNEICRFLD
jgi:hypothetical protein